MHVTDFLASIDSAEPKPVYLFCPFKGPRTKNPSFEPMLAQQGADRVVARFVDPGLRDLTYASYHADETDPAEIRAEAETMPFLAQHRVVVVQRAEFYDSERALGALAGYLEDPPEHTVVVFVAARVDKRSKFYKACVAKGEIVECPQLREEDAVGWVRRKAQEQEKNIEGSAARLLVARTGTHLSDVSNALTLVSNYVGDADTIREADVMAACAEVGEEEIWALTDAIAESNTNKAVTSLRALLDLGKTEFEILGSINWLMKTAYTVADPYNSGKSVAPFLANKVRGLAQKLEGNRMRRAFALCLETDMLFRTTGVDRTLALELLVIKLSTPVARSRTA